MFGKVPKPDIFVGIMVAVVTVIFDLAIAVIAGVIIAALVFAWEHAKRIGVKSYIDDQGWKVYELHGSLFFASAAQFLTLFSRTKIRRTWWWNLAMRERSIIRRWKRSTIWQAAICRPGRNCICGT